MFEIGDEILWVPTIDHALDMCADGEFAWEFEWQRQEQRGDLSGSELRAVLAKPDLSRDTAGNLIDQQGRKIKPLRPRKPWVGTVTAVDGESFSLDVRDGNGFATHHLAGQRYDTNKAPGTFHQKGD